MEGLDVILATLRLQKWDDASTASRAKALFPVEELLGQAPDFFRSDLTLSLFRAVRNEAPTAREPPVHKRVPLREEIGLP
jgi:hypothetical protein